VTWEELSNVGEKLKKAKFKETFRLNGGMMTWTQENLSCYSKINMRERIPAY